MTENRDLFWGKLITVVGVLLLLQTLGLLSWRLWEFAGPVFLIGCGILLIRRPESFAGCCCFGKGLRGKIGKPQIENARRQTISTVAGHRITEQF